MKVHHTYSEFATDLWRYLNNKDFENRQELVDLIDTYLNEIMNEHWRTVSYTVSYMGVNELKLEADNFRTALLFCGLNPVPNPSSPFYSGNYRYEWTNGRVVRTQWCERKLLKLYKERVLWELS